MSLRLNPSLCQALTGHSGQSLEEHQGVRQGPVPIELHMSAALCTATSQPAIKSHYSMGRLCHRSTVDIKALFQSKCIRQDSMNEGVCEVGCNRWTVFKRGKYQNQRDDI